MRYITAVRTIKSVMGREFIEFSLDDPDDGEYEWEDDTLHDGRGDNKDVFDLLYALENLDK